MIWDLVCGFNPSEKYESQLGLLFPIWGKKVPNHQPELLIIWPIYVHEWLKSTSPQYKTTWLHQKNAGSEHIRRKIRDMFWLAGRLNPPGGCFPLATLIWSDQGADLWGLDLWEESEFFHSFWLVVFRPTPLKNMSSSVTWWLIPLSKWVITPVIISGLTLLIPFITAVITHLLSGMSHQVGLLFPVYGKIKNVPNHQPGSDQCMPNCFRFIKVVKRLELGNGHSCARR